MKSESKSLLVRNFARLLISPKSYANFSNVLSKILCEQFRFSRAAYQALGLKQEFRIKAGTKGKANFSIELTLNKIKIV